MDMGTDTVALQSNGNGHYSAQGRIGNERELGNRDTNQDAGQDAARSQGKAIYTRIIAHCRGPIDRNPAHFTPYPYCCLAHSF